MSLDRKRQLLEEAEFHQECHVHYKEKVVLNNGSQIPGSGVGEDSGGINKYKEHKKKQQEFSGIQ